MASHWIETHAHLARDYSFEELDKFAESGICEKIWLHSIECFKNSARHCGNDEVLAAAKHYKGLIEPFAYCRAELGPDQVKRFKDAGFTGLKFIDPIKNYDDPSFFPVYAEAEKLGMPCFFHIGIIARKKSSELCFPGQLSSPGRMKPSMLDTIAAEFPQLQLVSAHVGVPWCNEMYESLWFYPNISCCVCGLTDYRWFMDALDGKAADGTPFYQKFMFATDAAYGLPGTWERVSETAIFGKWFFREAGATRLWGPHAEDFLCNNAKRILKQE